MERILGKFNKIDSNLLIKHKVENINNDTVINLIKKIKPKIVYVFGTGMISKNLINSINLKIINMHWGISPKYRGEGIITALAYSDFKHLGVTIHELNEKSDAGRIAYSTTIKVDKLDNFYSIGLKMTVLGTELFIKYCNQISDPVFIEQDLSEGRLYNRKYMRLNSILYKRAWKNIKSIKND